MEFTNSPSSTSADLGEGTLSAPEGLNVSLAMEESFLKPQEQQLEESRNSSSSSDSLVENLHALPL